MQLEQLVNHDLLENRPFGQGVQAAAEVAPGVLLKVPEGQAVQVVGPEMA